MLNEDIKLSIQNLISKIGNRDSELFLNDILVSITRIALDNTNTGDLKLLSRSLKEFRKSFKVFSAQRDVRKVSIFGSARTQETDPDYQLALNTAKHLTEKGMMVITGAGPGIMEAGNRGALPGKSFGLNLQLPFEQDANPFIIGDPKLITYKYFFVRKLFFIKESDATILFPGGFGTLDEGYESLTLLQTGKGMPRPVILMADAQNDYWENWQKFFHDTMLPKKYISADDLNLFQICKTSEDAIKKIQHFYSTYHSTRFVRDCTIIRLNKPISDAKLSSLNKQFKAFLRGGEIERTEPFEEERLNKEFLDKPRLVMKFNKVNYGHLVEFVWAINEDH